MSITRRGSKGPGYEYWSRRHPGYFLNPGKENKKRTHKHERQEAKKECEYETVESDQCLLCGTVADADSPIWLCESICTECVD